jgi:YD repeat-containing protein
VLFRPVGAHDATTLAAYTWTYDPASRMTQMVSPDGTNNYVLDATDQLTAASLTAETYSYDANGNRTCATAGSSQWCPGF